MGPYLAKTSSRKVQLDEAQTPTERFHELLQQVRKLGLPTGSFAVFGSGPMAAAGLRDVNDLDLIVTPDLWADLAVKYPVSDLPDDGHLIEIGDIEIYDSWSPPMGDLTKLIEGANVIEGIRFVRLEVVERWKQKRNKEKDRNDLRLLEEHLRQPTNESVQSSSDNR